MLKYIYMELKTVIHLFQEKQPLTETTMIVDSFMFLKNKTTHFSFYERREINQTSLERTLTAINENARIEFVCASLLSFICEKNLSYLNEIKKEINNQVFILLKCYLYTRKKLLPDKEDLMEHSYQTSLKLAGVKIGLPAICGAMLHEVVHHTETSIKEIEEEFGDETAKLVETFQKIRAIKVIENDKYVQHLREMLVAMAKDLRVIIIKMCSNIDRLKNSHLLSEEKKKNVALESREILAPIANLLGIWQLRWQLEDYSFKILEPDEYEKIARKFNIDERKNRDKYIIKTKKMVEKVANESGIQCQLEGRFKHFYSIYRKMKDRNKNFDDICDVFALRIVVNTVDECYRLIGIIHRLWKPKIRRFKDYIACPKNNNYRSLHTTVFGLNGRATEFQIRTKEMDEEANYGISAHWYYKNSKKEIAPWIQDLIHKQEKYENNEEFLANFSSQLLEQRIYVYTPKGDIIALPLGSTPVDFAYQIHSELGHKCVGAVVNDIHVSLDHQLSTNDVVKIVTDRNQIGPQQKWLQFVKTSQAQRTIALFLAKNK